MRTIVITGAARGFGRELVTVYHAHGWEVYGLVRREQDARALVEDYPLRCYPIVADVREDDVIDSIQRTLASGVIGLDVLINNAGNIKKDRGLTSTAARDIEDHVSVHCAGAFRCIQAALPFLRRSPSPRIINISSRWGSIERTLNGLGGLIYSYQIAKCAQNMLTACLHQELHPDGIRVFAIHPGRLRTSVAAADANVDPGLAAERLYDWVEGIDESTECGFHDLMENERLPW